MVVKKKDGIKMVVLLLFLLLNLFAFCTCSYAYVSRDYIDYTLDISLASADSNFDFFKNLTISQRDSLYVKINQQLDEWNLSKLTDANMITFHFNNSGKVYLYFTFSNCSFPENYELGFLNIEKRYDNYFGSVDGTIYYLSVTQSGNNFVSAPDTITNELRKMRFDFNTVDYNENLTVSTFDGLAVAGLPACYVGYPWENTNTDTYMIVQDSSENGHFNIESDVPEEPDQPSGDNSGETSGDNSGDTGGSSVDLSGIEQGIGNINQNLDKTNEKLDGISGEIGKLNENLTSVPSLSGEVISSGEIIGALDFEFAEDPYANFWLELTTGLSGALTNNVRSIDVQFRDKTYQIHLDNFAIQVPTFLKSFLSILSTVFIFWKMIKYWKIIIDNITSGNMDEVLEMNEEERNN